MAIVGFLPAAGRGVRFGATGYTKELFPLLPGKAGANAAPRPICEVALRAMAAAGATRAVVMISTEKTELMRVLGDGEEVGMSLSYVVQREPRGLPHALSLAAPWLDGADVVFAMPDTLVFPAEALAAVHADRIAASADLALGVFPVDEPERLGPVDVAPDGTVRRVLDKPGHREILNSWGVASFGPAFTALCLRWEQARAAGDGKEGILGHVFEEARLTGLGVRARFFPGGHMIDIGTPKGLRQALLALAELSLADSAQASTLR